MKGVEVSGRGYAGEWLTPGDVAERLKVSRSMVYALIRRGDLAAIYIGRLPRVAEGALAEYLASLSRGPREAGG